MLLPFLISRPIFAGAGNLDQERRLHLADKSTAMNCVTGLGGFISDRPIFTFGHFFKAVCIEGGFSLAEYRKMFSPRQRLQIGMGDCDLCQVAEFLRIGTTLLVSIASRPARCRRPRRFAGRFAGC